MHLDANLAPASLDDVATIARAAEELGLAGVWTSETQHDPFLPLTLAAQHTRRLGLGTAVAIALARSPMTLAYTAWDLAQQSRGRFILGLGTQVRAHIERRFGMPWPESPAGKLGEFVEALRAIWRAWQSGERLNFRGQHFKLTLMSPFFSPRPLEHPRIPIFLAGVNTGLARLAGEVADGFHVHPFHTAGYLRQVLRPAIAQGAARSGRPPQSVQVSTSVFIARSAEEREFVRSQVAFYASTPSYRPVLALHGWEEVGLRLSALAARGRWGEMPALVSQEMLDHFAIAGGPSELGPAILERYDGLLDRVAPYRPFMPDQDAETWAALARTLGHSAAAGDS